MSFAPRVPSAVLNQSLDISSALLRETLGAKLIENNCKFIRKFLFEVTGASSKGLSSS